MKLDRGQIFRALEPPPGGAARLRAVLRRKRRAAWPRWLLAPAAAAAVVAIVLLLRQPGPDTGPVEPSDGLMAATALDRLLGRESAPIGLSVSRGDERLAVSQLQSSRPNVRLYALEGVDPEAISPP